MNIIYVIKDPDTKEIRYVGKSVHGTKRFYEHVKPYALKANTHKAKWLNKLISNSKFPVFEIIDTAETEEQLDQLEILYIKMFRVGNLTNATDGGEGSSGRITSEETKKKISLKRQQYELTKTITTIPANKRDHIFKDGIEYKECNLCHEHKLLVDFGKWKSRWDGLNPACKECHAKRTAEKRKGALRSPSKS